MQSDLFSITILYCHCPFHNPVGEKGWRPLWLLPVEWGWWGGDFGMELISPGQVPLIGSSSGEGLFLAQIISSGWRIGWSFVVGPFCIFESIARVHLSHDGHYCECASHSVLEHLRDQTNSLGTVSPESCDPNEIPLFVPLCPFLNALAGIWTNQSGEEVILLPQDIVLG